MAEALMVAGLVVVAGFAGLVLALLRAAGRTSRREEHEYWVERCGGRAVPAHIATERGKPVARPGYLVAGGGLRRIS